MSLAIERFKEGYSNWRHNPFDDTSLAVDKTEDNLYIPASSPFQIQLLELPRKDAPSTVTVYCYDTSTYFTEVATAPAQSQFRVDYPPNDGRGTGLVQFNQNDAGKQVRVFYKATGSPILEEFLNTKISWPAGTPTDRQIAAYQSSTQKFVWRNNPIRMFHEGNAVYHASGESESCILFRFKKAAAEGKVLLELKGAKLHQAFYTELKSHDHAVGTLAGSQPTHQHGPGTLTGTQPNHSHPDVAPGTSQTGQGGNQAITVTAGLVAAAGNDAVTISGSVASAGGSPKTYPNQCKIYVGGVDKTASFLSKSGLSALGDGTSGHAFVTTGSGECDVTDWFPDNMYYEIKVTEPQNAGGRILLHLEMS